MSFHPGFQRLRHSASLTGFLQMRDLLAHVGGAAHVQFTGDPFLAHRGLFPYQPDCAPFLISEPLRAARSCGSSPVAARPSFKWYWSPPPLPHLGGVIWTDVLRVEADEGVRPPVGVRGVL